MVGNKQIARGFVWTSLTQGANVFFKFLSLIILSRILTPKEYGLIGIVMIFVEVGYMITDSGMGASLVKKRDCKHIDYDTLYIYNICVALSIYAILWVVAPYVANYYNESALVMIIRIISLQIIIHTLYTPQYIQILKNLDFRTIAIATIIATLGSLIVAVFFAYNGYGVWALVAQFVSEALIFLLYYAIKNRFIPKIQFSTKSFKEQFSFGINLLGANLLNTISNNIYNNVVAKVVSLRSTGFFVQATRIQNIPVSMSTAIVDRTLFPILSKCTDNTEFERVYFRIYGIVMMIVCLVSSMLSGFSYDLVLTFLGNKWIEASDVLLVLSLSIIPLTIQCFCRNALKSRGETFAILKNQIIKTMILICCLLLCSYWGFWCIVWGVVLAHLMVTISILALTSNLAKLSLCNHVRVIIPFILCSIVSVILPKIILRFECIDSAFFRLFVECTSACFIYVISLNVLSNPYCNMVVNILIEKLKRK